MTVPLVIPCFIPHKGCPHQCVFCNQHLITAAPGCRENLEQVIETYLGFKGRRSRVEVAFFGGNFLGLPLLEIEHLLERVYPYMAAGKVHGIRCSTRPDTVTRECLDLAAALGMTLVELGVQSMDDRVLESAGRGHTREDTITAIRRLQRAGIGAGVQVMAGLPGDCGAGAMETCASLASLKPDLARIYPLLVLAGSRLAGLYEAGRYTPLTLEQAVGRVAEMYRIFARAGVPVTRMGLQASEMMNDPDQVLAGPWHPAFGHLVYSRLMLEQACRAIDRLLETGACDTIVLIVHPRSLSRLQGNRKANLEALCRRYRPLALKVRTRHDLLLDQVRADRD